MAFTKSEKIWFNGTFVNWDDAKIHVLSHVVHYGSSVFEGMRCYATRRGPACFRLKDHVGRMFDSAKIYRMPLPYTREQISEAILQTIRVNKLQGCYVRPIAFRGYGEIGVNPMACPVDVVIAVWEWGKYLGAEAIEKGVAVRVSSWNRPAPNTFPTIAKAGGNYLNSQLVKMEALADGYTEGIALDVAGYVSEGSGENIFIIKNGAIYTPSTGASILPGITRHSVITLARDLGYRVTQRAIPREALYIADEVFFTGSAAEITPISSIDKIPIGNGVRGPITKRLQEEFFAITSGEKEDRHEWLTYV
jgi:branched-chain amino acid aminotransferase